MKAISVVVCAILLAGANAATNVNINAGGYYAFSVLAFPNTIATCHLKKPSGQTLNFTPGIPAHNGDRYELLPIHESMPMCSVMVTDLQSSDNGVWEVSFVSPTGSSNSQSFNLIVPGTESQESEEANGKENIEWLSTIEFPTKTGQMIDISLPRIDHEEECFILTNDNQYLRASELEIEDVTVHKSSIFVSCRIRIGPMSDSRLGEWAVCGRYTENNEVHERCQPAKIYWNRANNPDADWFTTTLEKFDHPVHYESTLSPAVRSFGDVVTCHVITPEGEDLVISHDSKYPFLEATFAHSICTVAIGPIHRNLLGDWTIYGIFRDSIMGIVEERFPFSMFLYDGENPLNQAYNVTVLESVTRPVNLGNTLNVEVSVSTGRVDSCYFKTPSGALYSTGFNNFKGASFVDVPGSVACQVVIGPITESLLGDWKLIGKFSNNGIFIERQQTFHIVQEDPENPIQEDREIIFLNPQTIEIEMGNSDRAFIPTHDFSVAESCLIRLPNGLQYQLMDGFSAVEGVKIVNEDNVECGIDITALSGDIVGDWTLISRTSIHSKPVERQLPFTIYVTESVEALQTAITLNEGEDLYVSLKNPTPYYETCKLIGPYGFECQAAVRDPERMETCGFIRRNVQNFNAGTWTITFGNTVGYRAKVAVVVNGENSGVDSTPEPITNEPVSNQPGSTETPISISSLTLERDTSVEQVVGPVDAVYCRLEDPQGLVVFDDFGRCHLSLDKVGLEHQGAWKMLVAATGRILTDEHQLTVTVRESEGKATVTTHVAQAKPIVTITCSVQTQAPVTGCKFRNPHGKILIAASGLTEGRYDFYGSGASVVNGVSTHECGIRITDPLTTDLGMWRCALDTAEETYYGHMPVLCPFALSNPATAATVQQEPILKATRSAVSVVEEEPATISCAVEANIRYCYFRASNGTTFTVSPGMSSPTMEYVGAGFDAGECGVRFHGLYARDGGRWSCHVGLQGVAEEQRDQFELTVHERMAVEHFTSHGNIMTVRGVVYERRALEYCRFVRIDGFGFTTDNVPSQYIMNGLLANGECQFQARDPTILDLHPWTIAARIRGQNVEIAKDTMESVIIGAPEPAPENNPDQVIIYRNNGLAIFMYVFLSLLLVSVIVGALFGPKKNRQWTQQRASAFRRSVSNSFKRRQQTTDPTPQYTP